VKDIDTSLKSLMQAAWRCAEEHGWHGLEKRTLVEEIALMHTELSEAVEEVRRGRPTTGVYYEVSGKPAGVAVELADVIIRIFDTCESRGIPLERALVEKMAYNETRAFLHGGKVL
jgi:NTP pyrophosphatase (non-canonical NTP hydrolase)